MWNHSYFTYILTNSTKTFLYVGVTNDLSRRLYVHKEGKGNQYSFTSKYFAITWFTMSDIAILNTPISREKELKGWRREKKLDLIKSTNPTMRFLNEEITEK